MAREKQTGYIIALKVIHNDQINTDSLKSQLTTEVKIHSKLYHPNIIQLYGYFKDGNRSFLILEYAPNGEVYSSLKSSNNSHFTEKQSIKYMAQLCSALLYCHSRNIIHRDIKPENLLLGKKGEIKIADFGLSAILKELDSRKTFCGTLDYLPPEIIREEQYGFSVDIWSLGILFYEFLTGYPPFSSTNSQQTFLNIVNQQLNFPSNISQNSVRLITRFLDKDPEKRITLKQFINDPYVKLFITV